MKLHLGLDHSIDNSFDRIEFLTVGDGVFLEQGSCLLRIRDLVFDVGDQLARVEPRLLGSLSFDILELQNLTVYLLDQILGYFCQKIEFLHFLFKICRCADPGKAVVRVEHPVFLHF